MAAEGFFKVFWGFFVGIGKPLPHSFREFVFPKIFVFLNFFSIFFFSIFIFLVIFLFFGIEKSWKSHYFVKNDHFEHTLASKDRFRFIPVRYEPSWIAYPIQPVPVHTGSGYRFRFRFWCFLKVLRIRPKRCLFFRIQRLDPGVKQQKLGNAIKIKKIGENLYVYQETPEPEPESVTGTGVNRNRLNRIRDSWRFITNRYEPEPVFGS